MKGIGKGRAIALIKDKAYPYKVAKGEKRIMCIDLLDLMPIIEGVYAGFHGDLYEARRKVKG